MNYIPLEDIQIAKKHRQIKHLLVELDEGNTFQNKGLDKGIRSVINLKDPKSHRKWFEFTVSRVNIDFLEDNGYIRESAEKYSITETGRNLLTKIMK